MNNINNNLRRLSGCILLILLLACPAHAAEVVQTYFIPIFEDEVHLAMNTGDNFEGRVGNVMHSTISLVAGVTNTVVYYDHWEDGYEADITNPVQSSTEVWGDNDAANGIPPGFAQDLVDSGDVILLETDINVPRSAADQHYDGRDKFATTRPVAVTRATYPLDPGAYQAGSVQVFHKGQFGFTYRSPVGTDADTEDLFEYATMLVQAGYDNTTLQADADNDGTFETTVILNEGEIHSVRYVVAGATATANKPVQAHLLTADIDSDHEARWFTLFPQYQWEGRHYTPVSSGGSDTARVFLFNPNNTAINVHYETLSSTGTIAIASDAVGTLDMPSYTAGFFQTTNGLPFLAVEAMQVGAGAAQYGNEQKDWGHTLLSEKMLTTMSLVSYGPGSTDFSENANPIWVTATSNTTVYIDYDGDPTTGPNTDPAGSKYNISTNLNRLESARIFDSSDNDQTGMRLYTLDNVPLVSAWGQDPDIGASGNGVQLDMGSMVLPFPVYFTSKRGTLSNDLNTNGLINPGDSVSFTIDIVNHGFVDADNVIVFDGGASNTAYDLGSSYLNGTNLTDDTVPSALTEFPFDELGYDIGSLPVGRTSTVEYVVIVDDPFPTNLAGIVNGVRVDSSDSTFVPVAQGGLDISKSSSPVGVVNPGDTITYTVDVVNTGEVTQTGVSVTDPVPDSTTFVTGSTRIELTGSHTNYAGDSFSGAISYNGSEGLIPWSDDWQEEGESDGATTGDVIVYGDTNDVISAYQLRIGDVDNGVYRIANISSYTNASLNFDYRRFSLDGSSDYVAIYGSSNGGGSWTELGRIQGAGTDNSYQPQTYDMTPYISTNTGIRFYSSSSLGSGDYVWFDDVVLSASGLNVTNVGGVPSVLAENYTLPPGAAMAVHFDVIVDNPPTLTQVVNTAYASSSESPFPGSASVVNTLNVLSDLQIVKTINDAGPLDVNDLVTYTLSITNAGSVRETEVTVTDSMPPGLTYQANSTWIDTGGGGGGGASVTNTFRDEFGSTSWANQDGTANWAADWQETDGGGLGAGSGSVLISGSQLRMTDGVSGTPALYRQADLSSATSATLTFDYSTGTGVDANDALQVQASTNGTSWTTLNTFTGPGSGSASYNLASYLSGSTRVRFIVSANYNGASSTSVQSTPAVSSDDAEETASNGSMYLNSSDLELIRDGSDQWVGIRFPGLNVPQGATITDAYIEFTVDETGEINPCNLTIEAQDADTAGTFTSSTSNITSRARTSENVSWSPDTWNSVGAKKQTPDLAAVVQEVVDRGGWSSGNAMAMILSGTGRRIAESRDTGSSVAPVLHVTYTSDAEYFYADNVQIESVEPASQTYDVLDNFGSISYGNNDGTGTWLSDWVEDDSGGGGAGGGAVQIASGDLGAYSIRINDGVGGVPSISRGVDLTGYTSAVFSFDYDTSVDVESGDIIDVDVSSDGASWTTLESIDGEVSGSSSHNITAYIGTNTSVRFIVNVNYGGASEYFYADNVQVEAEGLPGGGGGLTAGGPPPTLAEGYTLDPGEFMTVTFTGQVGNAVSAITNQACVTSLADTGGDCDTLVTLVNVPADITGQVREDNDGDGDLLDADSGLAGVTVELFTDPNGDGDPSDGVSQGTDVTDGSGNYSFLNLPPGSYVVEETNPAGYTSTADADGGNLNRIAVTLLSNLDSVSNDFLDTQPVTVSGQVRNDTDDDGDLGDPDSGLVGVTVELFTDPNGDGDPADGSSLSTNVTDGTGNYSFASVGPGNYVVVETDLATYGSSADADGGNPNWIGQTLASGVDSTGNDFLDTQGGDLLGQVRNDIDRDGNLADAESGLAGVTVVLYTDPNGDGDPGDGSALSTNITDGTGNYQFSLLAPGDYVVVSVNLPGYTSTADSEGANNDQVAVTMPGGSDSTGNDFLDANVADISGQLREDLDGDGDLGEADSGIHLFPVELYTDPDGNGVWDPGSVLVTSVTTDVNGDYVFPNIGPGDYVVMASNGTYVATGDSDGAPHDQMGVTLPGGVDSAGHDGVQTRYASLSGSVRLDVDGDGDLMDPDAGMPGIVIKLYSDPNEDGNPDDGTVIATTVTDGLGDYSFNNMSPGYYVIVEEDPPDYGSTADSDGGNLNQVQLALQSGTSPSGLDFLDTPAGFSITKQVSSGDMIDLGDNATYTITVLNTGKVNQSSVSITDTMPTNLVYTPNSMAVVADGESITNGSMPNLVTDHTLLEVGKSIVITYTAKVINTDAVINQACVSSALNPGGVCTVLSNNVFHLTVTQGLVEVEGLPGAACLAWSVNRDAQGNILPYDLLFHDNDYIGFHNSYTDDWSRVSTVTNTFFIDDGGQGRAVPGALGTSMRFYRAARENLWDPALNSRYASEQVYVLKNLQLKEGENWISLFMEPDNNSLAQIFGTNQLPAGSSIVNSTRIEWYGVTLDGRATNEVWLSDAGSWLYNNGEGLADDVSFPLNEGFNLVLPPGSGNRDVMVIGRVPTNTASNSGNHHEIQGNGLYNIVSYNVPHRIPLKDSGLRSAGFKGAPTGQSVNPNNSDELRIMKRGSGSLGAPKARILMDGNGQFVYWTGGSGSAENYRLDVDDALIIYTRASQTNWVWEPTLPYTPPTLYMDP